MNPEQHLPPDEQDNFQEYQQLWQQHASQSRVTVDANLLRQEVQRSQTAFRTTIFCRDFREVGVAIVMLPIWFYLGSNLSLPWTWYLTVPALLWIIGFMLVFRYRHKQASSKPSEPLIHCVRRSLTEQEDQVWLLRNVFWWYLLPFIIPIVAFFAQVTWSVRSDSWLLAILFFVGLTTFVLGTFYYLYRINQRAVKLQLEPRRQELLALLASLDDETVDVANQTD